MLPSYTGQKNPSEREEGRQEPGSVVMRGFWGFGFRVPQKQYLLQIPAELVGSVLYHASHEAGKIVRGPVFKRV